MKRRTQAIVLFLAMALLLLTSCATGADAQAPVSDALRRDAEAYAEAHDVPLEEAIWRLRTQDPVGELQAVLQEREPNAFAGLWIEHEPTYKVVVAVTRDAGRIERRYIEGSPLEGTAEVREADRTLRELEAAQTELMQILNEVDSRADTGIDVRGNCVTLYIADIQALQAKLDAADLRLPEAVCVVDTGPYAEAPPLNPPPGIVFPRQLPPEGVAAEMLALLNGTLVEEDGCLRVGSDQESHLIIWPYNYTITVSEDGRLQIRDGTSAVVAEVGEDVTISGGEVGSVQGATETEIPDRCTGPYWIAGSQVERAP